MNKDILNFNKEIALEVRKIIKKTQDFTKELILKSAKEKGLILEALNESEFNQSYLVKNVDYLQELIKDDKVKYSSKLGNNFGLISKTYIFEDLMIIENIKKGYYKVFSKEEIINLNNYESDFESLQSFLDKFIEIEED